MPLLSVSVNTDPSSRRHYKLRSPRDVRSFSYRSRRNRYSSVVCVRLQNERDVDVCNAEWWVKEFEERRERDVIDESCAASLCRS